MKNRRKLQEALCMRYAKCRTLGMTIGLAILAIVASPAQGQTVSWGPSVRLDDGFAPRVATSGTTVVQVHQATNGSGPLWYRTAQLGPNGTIRWFGTGSIEYDSLRAVSSSVGNDGCRGSSRRFWLPLVSLRSNPTRWHYKMERKHSDGRWVCAFRSSVGNDGGPGAPGDKCRRASLVSHWAHRA
jgi:hypothetical protein